MRFLASILLTLSFASLAAADTYTMYSVAGVKMTAPDTYAATVDIVNNKGSKAPIPANGSSLAISTSGCAHVPGDGGENAIVSNGPLGRSLLFASGATCKIVSAK